MITAKIGPMGTVVFSAVSAAAAPKDETIVETNPMTVEVRMVQQYGMHRVFPVNETAALFARMIGQKSFTPRDISVMTELGYTIVWK